MDKVQKILILVNIVIALGGAGTVFYAHNMIKPIPTNQVEESDALKTQAIEQTKLTPVPLKKIVVNLHSLGTRLRYLDVEMNVLSFTEEQKEIIKNNQHLFNDTLIEITSKLEPQDLDTVTGKILLENRIKKQVNAKLGQPVVKQIFFSGFVVQ